MTVRHRKTTLKEFLTWPESKPYLELIHGRVCPKSVPDAFHGRLQVAFVLALGPWSEANGGWTQTETRCLLEAEGEAHAVLPDVAWWSSSQLAALPDGPVRVAPTLVVEILSPDDRYGAVQDKVVLYLASGVSVVWIVDARSRNVTVYRENRPPQVVNAPAELLDPLLPGLVVSLTTLFARLPELEDDRPRIQQ